MRILHYFLGFPPYRTGGMTKFCMDLMKEQNNSNNEVFAIWPGRINLLNNKTKIIKSLKKYNIVNYEIINPLPVPLDEGISNVNEFTKKLEDNCYELFLDKLKPDIIHIHTLMGMHKEFIEAANKCNIKTIYTTHDYFGICPKVTLYKEGSICNEISCKECAKCNSNALSIKKIILLQSPLYRIMKNTSLLKLLRKRHRKAYFDNKKDTDNRLKESDFVKLRNYYFNILKSITLIHFNSRLSFDIYKKYLKIENFKILNISNKEIQDNRDLVKTYSDKIRFSYIASNKEYKGIYFIKEVMDDLWTSGKRDFELNIYCDIENKSEYMKVKAEGFKRDELKNIFSNTDILIIPSKWYETFGFTVIEALSFGVPVIVSSNVGAKDIIENAGIEFIANNKEDFKNIICKIDKKIISNLQDNVKKIKLMTWCQFYEELVSLYKEVINNYEIANENCWERKF